MKYLIGVVVIVVAAYFYPQIAKSVGGPCQALEAKLVDEARAENQDAGLVAGLLSNLSNGEIGRQIAEHEYPSLPTSLGCAIGYYDLSLDDM